MYLTALVGLQMVGINHWTLPMLFEPEHPGLQRINLDQRFFLWNKPKDDKREQAVSF